MLTFHHEPDPSKAVIALADRLKTELAEREHVIWLLGGGSNIPLSVQVMEILPDEHLSRLTCLLTDERYGVPGHADSNWQQLAEAGFMERGVTFPATLAPDLTMEDTCARYAEVIEGVLADADVIIAQFGIGGDGHIVGMLPRTSAVTEDTTIVGYDSGTFQRITMTPPVLRRVHAGYAYVYGETKFDALKRLQSETLPVEEQPAQILKQLPEAHLFTDQPIA